MGEAISSNRADLLKEEAWKKIQNSELYAKLQLSLHMELRKPSSSTLVDIKNQIMKHLEASGYLTDIENVMVNLINKCDFKVSKELNELTFLKKAQRSWEKCIVKSINNMCVELNLPLSKTRNIKDQKILSTKFENMTLGAEYNDAAYAKLRPVYSAADFFEVLVAIKNTNRTQSKSISFNWCLINTFLPVPSKEELMQTFSQLSTCSQQMGLCEMTTQNSEALNFECGWRKVGEKVISERRVSCTKEYLKYGCPAGLRKHMWMNRFNLAVTDLDILYFDQLKKSVYEYDMLVDYLIMKDVRLTSTNDGSFFVFEDVLYQVLLVFSRDTSILDHFKQSSAQPPKSHVKGTEEHSIAYPPSGIFPFHGFSMLAAPLCYVYNKAEDLYFVFRELYTRLFFRLHSISSHPQGILSICTLFEALLFAEDAAFFKHMIGIGAHPVKLVFNWFLFAYSGYLSTEETLQLWDRILGYDSLQILAVLAVAIILYRKVNLLCATTFESAEAILADISTIKVVPLLIYFYKGKCLT